MSKPAPNKYKVGDVIAINHVFDRCYIIDIIPYYYYVEILNKTTSARNIRFGSLSNNPTNDYLSIELVEPISILVTSILREDDDD